MLDARRAMEREIKIWGCALVLLGGTAVTWATAVTLESAVVTSGVLVVEDNVKKVQHPSGGVVGELNVKEGQRVTEGEILVRLDDAQARSSLAIVVNDLSSQRVRFARLAAERDGQIGFDVSEDLAARAVHEPDLAKMIEGELVLLRTRKTTKEGQIAQLQERIAQGSQEINALEEQRQSTSRQITIARDELKVLEVLDRRYLVPKTRMTALQRELARNEGMIGEINAKIAQARGRISEIELQILQVSKEGAVEGAKELREVETRIGELQERRNAAEDHLKRIEIRAPISGVVHQLNVHTIGGVISQTEPLMLIVPEAGRLIVEVRINPQDIDNLQPGQNARVRFSAFNQRTTPEVPAKLIRIAADLTRDPQSGTAYYAGGVLVSEADLKLLDGLRLLPGMPAEVYITTGHRTPASYLVKPLLDNMNRAMREE